MRKLIAILILSVLFSCSDRKPNNSNVNSNKFIEYSNTSTITAIDAKLPFKLDKVNLENKNSIIHLNDTVIAKIKETIKKYAKDIEFSDSSKRYLNTYINTIQIHDSLQTIFLVLLKHYPTDEINSRILFYDNQKKEFADKDFEFKLYALYDFNNGKLTPSNLKTNFKITTPEIQVLDYNKDGLNDYKFTRLFHNGTFNSIQTTILTIKNSKIDTLFFNEKLLGKWAEK